MEGRSEVYVAGMKIFRVNTMIDGRHILNFEIRNGIASGNISGKHVQVECIEGETIGDIKRKMIAKANCGKKLHAKYRAGMEMFRECAQVDGRDIYNFKIHNGIASGRVSCKDVQVECVEEETIVNIKRRLVKKANCAPLKAGENGWKRRQTIVRGHDVRVKTRRKSNGKSVVNGTVDGEKVTLTFDGFMAIEDEYGFKHDGKTWLRTMREMLVEKYEAERNPMPKPDDGFPPIFDEDDLKVLMKKKGFSYVGDGHLMYYGKRIEYLNKSKYDVMNRIKEIQKEIIAEMDAFFNNLKDKA